MSQVALNQTIPKDLSFLEIKSVTWNKDSHGLFDYENKHLQVKKSELHQASKLYRSGQDFLFFYSVLAQEIEILNGSPEQMITDQLQYLLSIDVSKDLQNKALDNFVLVSQNNNSQLLGQTPTGDKAEEAFVIVRSFKNRDGTAQGYTLKVGDIIKLGRIEYAVMEIMKQDLTVTKNPIRNLFIPTEKYKFKMNELQKETKGKVCRICLDEFLPEQIPLTHPLDNILLATCNCKGSCQYSHYLCLKNWIESKVVKRCAGNTIQWIFKRLECEVCKEPIPEAILIDDQELNLIPIEKPQSPYVMLESIVRDKKTINGIYLMQLLPDDLIKMGRGHYCELRVSDISVSRFHAFIKNVDDQFVVFDNNSKFGTLVLMDKEYKLSEKKVAIQIGRTVLSLVMKNQFMLKHSKDSKILISGIKDKSNSVKQSPTQKQDQQQDPEKIDLEEQIDQMQIEKNEQ